MLSLEADTQLQQTLDQQLKQLQNIGWYQLRQHFPDPSLPRHEQEQAESYQQEPPVTQVQTKNVSNAGLQGREREGSKRILAWGSRSTRPVPARPRSAPGGSTGVLAAPRRHLHASDTVEQEDHSIQKQRLVSAGNIPGRPWSAQAGGRPGVNSGNQTAIHTSDSATQLENSNNHTILRRRLPDGYLRAQDQTQANLYEQEALVMQLQTKHVSNAELQSCEKIEGIPAVCDHRAGTIRRRPQSAPGWAKGVPGAPRRTTHASEHAQQRQEEHTMQTWMTQMRQRIGLLEEELRCEQTETANACATAGNAQEEVKALQDILQQHVKVACSFREALAIGNSLCLNVDGGEMLQELRRSQEESRLAYEQRCAAEEDAEIQRAQAVALNEEVGKLRENLRNSSCFDADREELLQELRRSQEESQVAYEERRAAEEDAKNQKAQIVALNEEVRKLRENWTQMAEQEKHYQLQAEKERAQKVEVQEQLCTVSGEQHRMMEHARQAQEDAERLREQTQLACASSSHREEVVELLQYIQQETRKIPELNEEVWIAQEHETQTTEEFQEMQSRIEQVRQADEETEGAMQRASMLEEAIVALKQHCVCPITQQLMSDPVIAFDGHSYERSAIQRWLTVHCKSPMTNQHLSSPDTIPNILANNVVRTLQGFRLVRSVSVNDEDAAGVNASIPELQEEAPVDEWGLHLAAMHGDSDACLALLAKPSLPRINDSVWVYVDVGGPLPDRVAPDSFGWTVLHHAARHGLTEVCQSILSRPDFTQAQRLTTMAPHSRADDVVEIRADQIAEINGHHSLADMIRQHLDH